MKKLCVFLVLLLSVMLNGCGYKQDTVSSSYVTNKDSTLSSNVANKVEDKVSTSGSVKYDITKATYTDKNIKINFLQISNLSDSSRQKNINELIKTSALEVLDDYKDSLSSLNLNMDYEIKYKGADFLSIEYLGLAVVKDAAYPVNVIHTTNIDLEKEEQLVISEVVTVNDSFAEKIMAGRYNAYNSDLNLEPAEVKNVLNDYDSHSLALLFHPYTAKFYLTKDSLGVSIEVAHALGDHLELEMPYTSLGELLSVKPQGSADISSGRTSNNSVGSTVTVAPNSQSNSVITQEKASSIITEYLLKMGISKDKDPNLVIALDRTDNAQGKEYFVFHIFDNMSDHTATIGWYGVQKNDGSLYDFTLMKPI